MINKITGVKVACFKSLVIDDPEFSFWNQVDARIDSMESGLPPHIMGIIKKETDENLYTNSSLLSEDNRRKENYEDKYKSFGLREEIDLGGGRGAQITNDHFPVGGGSIDESTTGYDTEQQPVRDYRYERYYDPSRYERVTRNPPDRPDF